MPYRGRKPSKHATFRFLLRCVRATFSRPLCALALLAGCSSGTPARSEEPASQQKRKQPQPLHHAKRTASGYENNYGNLPRESFLKWRWERFTQGLPKPPANGYDFPMAHPDIAWLKANRTADTLTWIGHATRAGADRRREHPHRSRVLASARRRSRSPARSARRRPASRSMSCRTSTSC